MIRKIDKLLDEIVRPSLAAHGGNVEIIDIANNKLYLKLSGGCQGCSSSASTLKDGIERIIKEKIPVIEEVIDLTNHSEGQNPYYK